MSWTLSEKIDYVIRQKHPRLANLALKRYSHPFIDHNVLNSDKISLLSDENHKISENSEDYWEDEFEWNANSFDLPSDEGLRIAVIQEISAAAEESNRLKLIPEWELNDIFEDAYDSCRYFSDSRASANLEYWNKQPYWSIQEAVAITLGKDPTIVTKHKMDREKPSKFKRSFDDRLKLLENAVAAGDITDPISPSKLKKFLESKVNPLKSDQDDITKQERSIFYSFVMLLALKYSYSFDERADNSAIPTAIANDLADHNFKGNVKTVRKHLKDAADWARANGYTTKSKRNATR